MTAQTWIGGGNNKASNAADWSLKTKPKPGDTLTFNSGTINVSGNDLYGDVLAINYAGGAHTINLAGGPLTLGAVNNIGIRGGGTVTLNVSGYSSLALAAQPNNFAATINLAAGADLLMLTPMRFLGGATVNGLRNSEIVNNSNLSFSRTSTVNAAVVGKGTMVVNSYEGPSLLNLSGPVAAGQDVKLSGGDRMYTATLNISQPLAFKGSVGKGDLAGGFVDLLGLHVTSYDMKQGILQLYSGNKIVDTLRIDAGTVVRGVGQGITGVVIGLGVDLGSSAGHLAPVPLHH